MLVEPIQELSAADLPLEGVGVLAAFSYRANGVMDMNWIWLSLLVFIFLLLIIIFTEVKVHFTFNKEEKNDFLEIHIWLFFKLIHIKKKIPIILFESIDEGIKFKSKTEVSKSGFSDKKKDRITSKKVSIWRQQFKRLVNQIHDFYRVVKSFLKHIKVDLYKWESVIGTGDAMKTGLLNGILWGVKGSTLAFLSKYMILNKKPVLKIDSDFKNEIYQSRIECILRFRLGYLILTGMRLIKLYLGGEKSGRRTSYSRINENSYGKFKGNG